MDKLTAADINARLAARTAALLAEWAGLSPAQKVRFGDPMVSALTLMSGAVRSTSPSSDAVAKMNAYLLNALSKQNNGAYTSFSVDYGPEGNLRDLAAACGINTSWPNKSRMSVTKVYPDGSGDNSVSVSTGYHAPTITHYLTNSGWLVAHVRVDPLLHDLVIKGIASGDVPATVATFEPF